MYEILNVHVKIIGWSQEIDMVRQIWIYRNKHIKKWLPESGRNSQNESSRTNYL